MKSFETWLLTRVSLLIIHKVNTWSGIVLIAWASVLFLNTNPLTTNINYKITTSIFNESSWELMAFGIGCSQLIGVLSGSKWIRFVGSFFAAWIFFTLGYALVSASIISPGAMVHFGWGCANLHSMLFAIKFNKQRIN